jgi:ribosomal protein L37AE/L43A
MKHAQTEAQDTEAKDYVMPTCRRCQRAMTVSRIVPEQPGRETRTYRCTACGEEWSEPAYTR